ncbi:MAG: response regulator [Methyloligellaceae bacterium]
MSRDGVSKTAEQDLVLFREVFRESQDRRRLRVLVVEDDDEDFSILKRHLEAMEDFDAEISRATTLDAAMDIAEKTDFHIALVDYWLGADTGPRVLEGLGGRHGALPTILVTGLSHDAYKKAAMKAGAIHCLSKDDINTTVLQDTVRSVLHTHELESKLRTDEA